MRSGYYHLELTTESQPKSAFVVGGPKGGKWEFKRCPFGLTQAPAYFQALVNQVLEGFNFAFGYLDDILIFSPDMEQHLEHVRALFEHLRAADLKLTKRKCSFLKAHVTIFGSLHIGSRLGTRAREIRGISEDASTRGCDRSQKIPGVRGVLP